MIGAGSSGIAATKALHESGIEVECFEKSDRVGGNWVFRNVNGMSSAYKHLHINTSRERMEYPDFPMPKWYPDFPHHTHLAEYFGAYVEHIERERAKMFKRYVASERHTMQVDFDNYLHDLGKEMQRGARRAQERGFRLSVPPRVERGDSALAA